MLRKATGIGVKAALVRAESRSETLRERITIQAAPERIWMLLADPSQWTLWNPKFVSIRRSRSGAVVAGEQFSMISRLKQLETPSDILVQEVMPLRRVIVRQLFTHKNRSRHIDLNLELSAKDGAIEVCQTLNHDGSGIPWFYKLAIWLLHRFGREVGAAPLMKLKALAERSG